MHYSSSKREWMNETDMNHVHLVNAYDKAILGGGPAGNLRAEILRRLAEPITFTVGSKTVTITPTS
jgi:hypothetical protein